MSPGITTGVGGASLDWDRRRRVTPVQTKSQEAWPEADLGDEILLEMRAVVERRQACALQKGARRIARCGGCYPAFAGVPLPSIFRSPDGAQRNPGRPRGRILRSRIALRSIRATKPGTEYRKPGPTPDFLKAEPGSPRRSSESRTARDTPSHAIFTTATFTTMSGDLARERAFAEAHTERDPCGQSP